MPGGPSGSAPVTFSERAVEVITARKSVEAGIRSEGDEVSAHPIRSNYFDLAMIFDYWGPQRLNHHTEATSMLYGARECARLIVDEGVDQVVARHALHGGAMLRGLEGLGLTIFGDTAHKMNNVTAVMIPDGIDGDAARGAMLNDFGIEIGTSFGPLHGKVWRIGTMGYNARRDTVLTTLAALEAVLRRGGVSVTGGGEWAPPTTSMQTRTPRQQPRQQPQPQPQPRPQTRTSRPKGPAHERRQAPGHRPPDPRALRRPRRRVIERHRHRARLPLA
ncbi:alanine--glyoxylate aminotransferase family protein [Frondihabitans sp. PAMC 28766]|uniref:pyridoxal-phosphate-dependent aminotransferase family protein n=1 Tax=Frondihabitans sp. PAMC 28766 TaxID=1795630 RepID=UPI001EF4DAC1|nr:hypothetical protein [Frondihabitans sp. PAMC 28766]